MQIQLQLARYKATETVVDTVTGYIDTDTDTEHTQSDGSILRAAEVVRVDN